MSTALPAKFCSRPAYAALAAGIFTTVGCEADCLGGMAEVRHSGSFTCPDGQAMANAQNSQLGSAFLPPASFAKCFGAAAVGSIFAGMCVLLEGRKSRVSFAKPALSKVSGQNGLVGSLGSSVAESNPERPSEEASNFGRVPQSGSEGKADSCSWRGQASPRSVKSSPSSGSARRELSEAEQTERQVKSILNKLTFERFGILYKQLLSCFSSSDSRSEIIDVISREVFKKATTQHTFVEMYADLCSKLNGDLQCGGFEVNFRRALLTQCQESFNAYLEPPRIDNCLGVAEQYEELAKYKTKMLGNAKLIGHLLRLRMLSPKVLFHCTDELIAIGTSEALETLCAFLETLGPAFDRPDWSGYEKFHEVFSHLKAFSGDSCQPPRIKCLILGLLEKRSNRWRPASEDTELKCSGWRLQLGRGGMMQKPSEAESCSLAKKVF